MQKQPDQTPDTPPPQDKLPRWDLSALFPGKDSPEFKNALADIDRDVKSFAQDWRGKVAKADGAALGAATRARLEAVFLKAARDPSFAALMTQLNVPLYLLDAAQF